MLEIVRKSGDYLKDNLGKVKKISFKGDFNLVTEVDQKTEEIVIKTLRKYFPGDGFLSEEAGSEEGTTGRKWVIDPLDGTTNYAHGFPVYAVSIALEENGKPVFGAVFNPERDELFTAEINRGARLNGKSIRVSHTPDLKRSLLATGFSYNIKELKDNNIAHFEDFLFASQAVRRPGSASLDLCYVACGRLDGFWELELNPWDTAAGWLIVKEAGGEVTTFNGGRYSHYLKEILASNGKIHKEMCRILTARK
ncbi:MAG: inositol monophosphatase family protein [Candidatus Omnitrophota bacterium]|nr:inositol monophosphatase family protein [Candidatus Omnitrophota bacterium]